MAGAGLRCCCTPPPNAKELGACCYTEEIFGILNPRCIPSLTEEECAGSTYPNAAFSAGLACGDRVACAIDVLNPDGPKAIKKVFTPTSRFNSYTRDIRFTDLFTANLSSDYRRNITTNYNPDQIVRQSNSLSNQLIDVGDFSEQFHQPVNYFFFVTNDNTLYLCITLDNQYQQLFTDPNTVSSRYQNRQTRIFKISSNFTTEDKNNITATDNFNNTPMLVWEDGSSNPRYLQSIFGSVIYSLGPFWATWAKEMRFLSIEGLPIYVNDYFENLEFLRRHLIGEKGFSKISCKFGGRITLITTQGNVVQGGSYNAGAAVAYLPVEASNPAFEVTGLRFIPYNNRFGSVIESESDQLLARQRLESNDSNSSLDIQGITGSSWDRTYRGGDNLKRVEYYNQVRAESRDQKIKSIRSATKIEENFYATAVLTSTGGIYTWGDPKYGGDDYYNSVKRLTQGESHYLILNSENQNTESSSDYVELLPMSRGFLGFKTWDGVNNNVTFFGFFALGGSETSSDTTDSISRYETFIQNGKRYEPSDAILLNDGGVILKAFGEDNYTVVGGKNGYGAVHGNFSAPSSGLTIKKALCGYQNQNERNRRSSLFLILWSDGTLQAISFSDTVYPTREDDIFGSLRPGPYQFGWERWMDEETLENRIRTFSGVRDIFLINQNYGFGYILENDDADGYNTVIILKRGVRYNNSTGKYDHYNESEVATTNAFYSGFNMNYQVTRDTGADVEDIYTTAYQNIENFGVPGIPVDTGFTKVRYKKIDYATSTLADPYSSYGANIDCLQDHRKSQVFDFTAAFLYTKQNFDTDLADGENNIIGIYYRKPLYTVPFGSTIREKNTEDVFVKHTRVNAVDSQTEDAGSPLFNFDFINLFVNQKGQLLSAPGIQFKNDDYWSNPELFLTGEVDAAGQDTDLSINNITTIETFENCADSICIICGGTNHKCNVETGECFDCVPAGSTGYSLPSCDEVPDVYPWSLTLNGPCESNPCPPEFTVGCCCAYYQRTPEEPVWFLQQVVTIPRNELTGIDQYIQLNGCFENSSFQYYDGSAIPSADIEYTFTPFDDNFTELNCGAELFSNDFVQTCGEDLFDGSNTFVSVDSIDLREPCADVNGNRTVDITFTKRVQGLRCKVDYNIPVINSLLQDIGCSPINNDSGTITFLENENEKTITLNLCCKLTGTFNVSYTVSPV